MREFHTHTSRQSFQPTDTRRAIGAPMRWVLLGAALVGLVVGEAQSAWASSSVSETQVNRAEGQLTVQIVGRFCEYQRHEVVLALRDVWSVRAVEFLTDHGTLRVRYQSAWRSRDEIAEEVGRALSLGLLCSAQVQEGEHQAPQVATLLDVRR